ncbi:hypothetical protein J5J10_00615 [Ciceribacter sp. L1K23]|uniref:hypothetical protein n=1 Tax=unclassified Ciceribacter TaxID=2628820 RepID=UPI001ABE8E7E|nr:MULTISPECIES: hypothetical protein [unclassified Ciceribacter]MBO3762468.1 hypothetical protein [Ciceribacter sp. L1K22]MBR0554175.1 hypothetical protein [Ciceribacter sp. L1K23]
MAGSSAVSVVICALAFPVAAQSADCKIERAIYGEAETGIELTFFAASGENTPVTHGFNSTVGDAKLEGHVMFDPEIERQVGMLMNNCPEGDVTGADLDACTVWKGIPYGIDQATGRVDLIPPEGADAPDAILLPGFGPAVMASRVEAGRDTAPWDVFEFKRCAS